MIFGCSDNLNVRKSEYLTIFPVAADLESDAIECRDFKSLYSLLRIINPQQLKAEKNNLIIGQSFKPFPVGEFS